MTTIDYRTAPEWLESHTIYLVRAGSHAHGTAREGSDLDLRGLAIPPLALLTGFKAPFEQWVHTPGDDGETADIVVFALAKFFRLAVQCNPNALELLFVHDDDILHLSAPMERLLAARGAFLSQRATQTFQGYAMGQLKRIRSHRKWLLDPPVAAPTRAEYDLPERTLIPKPQLLAAQAAIQKQLDRWEIDFGELDEAPKLELRERISLVLAEQSITADARWAAAGRLIGLDENFLVLMDRERRFKAAASHFRQYQQWLTSRNPTRAALEARHGYDTKHAAHLIRLLRMCAELLEHGTLTVRRPDAEELLAIRDGMWTYDELLAQAEAASADIVARRKTSLLPKAPDVDALSALCAEMTEQFAAQMASVIL